MSLKSMSSNLPSSCIESIKYSPIRYSYSFKLSRESCLRSIFLRSSSSFIWESLLRSFSDLTKNLLYLSMRIVSLKYWKPFSKSFSSLCLFIFSFCISVSPFNFSSSLAFLIADTWRVLAFFISLSFYLNSSYN